MSEKVKALTAEEIEQLDGVYRLANNGPMGAFGLYRLWPRIRATLDARDAEIAALKRERRLNPTDGEELDNIDAAVKRVDHTSHSVYETLDKLVRERDDAIHATARTCAQAVCVGCATGLPTRGTRHDYGEGGWLLCGAEAIRHAYPEAFKEAPDAQ
jgi:hypothetical protein